MKLTEFRIERYGPLRQPITECDGGLEVYYGPNESGKTLLLEALLRMLDPNATSVMDGIDRVADPPAGYAVIEAGGETYQLGDGQVLTDIAPITANHLRNIFVVRDSDLRIRQHHEFYDSVTEQIGDLHTSEIEDIQDRLEDLGRLTSRRRNVSSAAQYDHASDVRDSARSLISDIREYIEEATDEGLDELERQLIDVQSRRQRIAAELTTQRRAKRVADYERLSARLETVERLRVELTELEPFERDTLDELTELEVEIDNQEDQIDNREKQVEELRAKNESLEAERRSLESELQPLARRENAKDELADDLEAYRDTVGAATGGNRRMRLARIGAIAGVGLGGIATVLAAIQGQIGLLLPLLFLAIGLASGYVWYRDHQRLAEADRRRRNLLEAARDAGLNVDEVTDIGPAIAEFRDQLEGLRGQIDELENQVEVNDGLIKDHQGALEGLRSDLKGDRAERDERLEAAGVTSVEAYREKVERREEIEGDLRPARQSLIDAVGEPDADDQDPVEYWRDELEATVEDLNLDAIVADEYDEDRHDDLEGRIGELETEAETLRTALEEHRQRIDDFRDRATGLDTGSFVDEPIQLKAPTIDGLDQLAADLEALADQIDWDAGVSREALEIFDELHSEEEDQLADLFEPGGRASEVFETITDDRYQQVEYDPDEQVLKVHRDSGEVLTADELSHATRDQLYLATRISLAEQLLETDPGFFFMDDAFLPADQDRLEEGFRVLQQLVEEESPGQNR